MTSDAVVGSGPGSPDLRRTCVPTLTPTVASSPRNAIAIALTLLLAAPMSRWVAPQDADEPIVSTRHAVSVGGQTLTYTARVGRIAIRDNEAGDVHGRMFFVSYTLDSGPGQPPRPLTFVWNGGPGSNAALVHLIGFGPRRIAPPEDGKPGDGGRWRVEANPGTWLRETDLVFVDPIGTGYSRPTRAEYGREFYQNRGDAESVAEFIRVYRTRFDAWDSPLFLAGESFGVTRAAGVAEALQARGTAVSGVILLGLTLPLGAMPEAMHAALGLPSLTVAAFTQGKLSSALQRDLDVTRTEAETWSRDVYAPALARRDRLTSVQRDSIVRGLSRLTGLAPALVDRRTLVVPRMQLGNDLLRREGKFIGQYDSRMVGPLDTTQRIYDPTKDPSLQHLLDDVMVLRYLRDELGYRSDLRYQGPFGGGYPPPTAFRGDWMSMKWNWRAARDSTSPPPQPLRAAMAANPSLRVLVGCGIYDLVCSYYGNARAASMLEPSLRGRVTARSYPGGHAMYTDPRAQMELQRDVAQFIREAVASEGQR